ncbi:hypothetical protein GCM10027074_10580 [Streptomyces deserti]
MSFAEAAATTLAIGSKNNPALTWLFFGILIVALVIVGFVRLRKEKRDGKR